MWNMLGDEGSLEDILDRLSNSFQMATGAAACNFDYSVALQEMETFKRKDKLFEMADVLSKTISKLTQDVVLKGAIEENRKVFGKVEQFCEYFLGCNHWMIDSNMKCAMYPYMATLYRMYGQKENCIDYWQKYWYTSDFASEFTLEFGLFANCINNFTTDMKVINEFDRLLSTLEELQGRIQKLNLPRNKIFAQILYHKGVILRELGRNEESLKQLKLSFKSMKKTREPTDTYISKVCMEIGITQSALKRHEEAIKTFETLLGNRTKHYLRDKKQMELRLQLYLLMGEEYITLKNYKEALKTLRGPFRDSEYDEGLRYFHELGTKMQNRADYCLRAHKADPDKTDSEPLREEPKLIGQSSHQHLSSIFYR